MDSEPAATGAVAGAVDRVDAAALPPPSLTRNQQAKRIKRQMQRERREGQESAAREADPVCARLSAAHAAAQRVMGGHFRARVEPVSCDAGCRLDIDAASLPPAKKRRVATDSQPDAPAATLVATLVSPTAPCLCSAMVRSGTLCHLSHPTAVVVVDHALQIRSSYTSHRLTGEGRFHAISQPTRHYDGAASTSMPAPAAAASANSQAQCCCDLFRLDVPYQLMHTGAASASSAPEECIASIASEPKLSANDSSGAGADTADNAKNVVLRNDSAADAIVQHDGRRCVMPAHSAALIGDLAHAGQLAQLRPPGGFRLVVADPPWESKSVRRSGRYACMDHRRLMELPVGELLSRELSSFVCVWVTNNPLYATFVRETLFPLWGVEHVATWLWLKVADDGRMVLPLHAATEARHRKPYEQLLVGWRRPPPTSGSVATGEHQDGSKASHAASAVTEALPSPAAALSPTFPRDLVLISVPGAKHHSRKPQLGELFAPFLTDAAVHPPLPSAASPLPPVCGVVPPGTSSAGLASVLESPEPASPECLELFARHLTRGWCSWGNQCMLFQRMHEA